MKQEEILNKVAMCHLKIAFTEVGEALLKVARIIGKVIIKILKKFNKEWNKRFKKIRVIDAVDVISVDRYFNVKYKIKKYHSEWVLR